MALKTSLKTIVLEYGMIVIGSFILATGFVFFINPYKIVPGGVYGIGIVVHSLVNWIPVGSFGLSLDIPLVLIGIRILGPKFGTKTIMAMVLTPIFMDTMTHIFGENDPLRLADDLLLSCIFGAILIGFGLGLIFRARGTSGGSDIIAMIINKYTHVSMGQLLIIVDSTIVLLALIVFRDWKIPLYSWLVIYITGQVIDITIKGLNYDSAVMVISKEHEAIKQFILQKLERGGTYLKGEGMYTGEKKEVVFVVVSRRELPLLKEQIKLVDPYAFVTVLDTREILGEGFRPLNDPNN